MAAKVLRVAIESHAHNASDGPHRNHEKPHSTDHLLLNDLPKVKELAMAELRLKSRPSEKSSPRQSPQRLHGVRVKA